MSRATIVSTADGRAVYYGRDHAAKLARLGAGHTLIASRAPSPDHLWDGREWQYSEALHRQREPEAFEDLRRKIEARAQLTTELLARAQRGDAAAITERDRLLDIIDADQEPIP